MPARSVEPVQLPRLLGGADGVGVGHLQAGRVHPRVRRRLLQDRRQVAEPVVEAHQYARGQHPEAGQPGGSPKVVAVRALILRHLVQQRVEVPLPPRGCGRRT
jgi:hypothetical protein